jgi:hypothetical protein
LDVTPGACEFYLVTNRIWKKSGMPKNGGGSLCVGCIEKRLGRRLRPTDFDFSPEAAGYNVPKLSTPRLVSRMFGDGAAKATDPFDVIANS